MFLHVIAKYLTHPELRGCNISFNGLLTIAKMSKTNNVLIMIALNDNDFTSDDLKIVLQEMKTTIYDVEISGSG